MHSCSAGRSGRSLISRTSRTSSLRQPCNNYTGDGNTFNVHFSGDPGGNQTGINSLLVFDIPAEIGWKVGKIPMRIFGDFATNLEADDRATAAGHPDKDGDRYAYQIGLGLGQL